MSAVHTTTPSQSPHRPTHRAGTGFHHWWRWVAGVVVLVLVAFLRAAWYFSGPIYSGALASTPFTHPPTFDDVRVVSVPDGRVTLDKGPDAGASFAAPASYGMVWDGGLGSRGSPRPGRRRHGGTRPDCCERLCPRRRGDGGLRARLLAGIRPVSLGLEWTDVSVADSDGPLPAWFFPAECDRTTMAVVVHGQNGWARRLAGRRHPAPPRDAGTRRHLPQRAGAPADASGQLGYGATEWPTCRPPSRGPRTRRVRHPARGAVDGWRRGARFPGELAGGCCGEPGRPRRADALAGSGGRQRGTDRDDRHRWGGPDPRHLGGRADRVAALRPRLVGRRLRR